MKQELKNLLRNITPPVIWQSLNQKVPFGFGGNYQTWAEALAHSHGYDSPIILDKVKEAALKVKDGEAVYERDSVVFDKIEYSWPVLAILLWSATKNAGCLDVLDFGGALGSSYRQNFDFIKQLKQLKWSVVEQENLINFGRQNFKDKHLSFHHSIESALGGNKPRVFLASSTIQYIEKPYDLLEQVVARKFESLIFDRTPFWSGTTTLTVQKVPPRIYAASYPAWIFNIPEFRTFFEKNGYKLLAEQDQGFMNYNRKNDLVTLKHFSFWKK